MGCGGRWSAAAPRGPRAGVASRGSPGRVRRSRPARRACRRWRCGYNIPEPGAFRQGQRYTVVHTRRSGGGGPQQPVNAEFVYIVRPSPVNVVDITAVHGVLVRFVLGVCVIEPLRAARARAVCARAVRLRAGRVVRLHSAHLHRAAFARHRRRHPGGTPARALCWCCACLRCCASVSLLALRVPAVHALAVHACVVHACAPHASVVCTCYAVPCCACPRCALSCWSCGVLVQRSPTSWGFLSLTSPTPLSAPLSAL